MLSPVMQCVLVASVSERCPPRKAGAARTLRLRALDRIAKEIACRRGRGSFTATDIGALFGDKPGDWQTTMETKAYIETAIRGFLADPPDTDYQRGYLAALLVVYGESMDGDADLISRADLLSTPSLD